MSYYLSPLFGAGTQLQNNNGALLSGGQIFIYVAGTTTLAATWTTNVGNVQNANPIILDASGRVPNEIWLLGGNAYKFIVQDSNNNPIGVAWDNISGVNDAAQFFPGATFASIVVASASTVNIGIAASTNITITGSVTIAAFDTVSEGTLRIVNFTGTPILTYNATSMKLIGGVSKIMAAGGTSLFRSLGGGNWIEELSSMIAFTGGSTRTAAPLLYQLFFDTNLGQPIWCTQLSPVIWVNSAGAQV